MLGGERGELSYSCCKGLCPLKPRHGQIMATSRGSDAVKGFKGIRSAVGRKPAKRSHAIGENKMILGHFPYHILVFVGTLSQVLVFFFNALEKVKMLT